MEGRQESTNIVGVALTQSFQVDARTEDLALTGQNDGFGVRQAQFLKTSREPVTKLDVERIGFAVRKGQHCNSFGSFTFDHAPCSAMLDRCTSIISRCDSPSACTTAMVKTMMASI